MSGIWKGFRKSNEGRVVTAPPLPPMPECSLGQLILDNFRSNPTKPFLLDAGNDKCLTSGEVLRKSVKLANILTNRGIKPGDRISIISENRLDWLIPACATLFVGGVIAPLNSLYTELELKHLLGITKPCMAFVTRRSEKVLTKMLGKLTWSMEVIELDDEPHEEGITTLKKLLQSQPETVDPYLYKPVDIGDNRKHPGAILCSSGTTGMPKGVTISQRHLMIYALDTRKPEFIDVRPGDRVFLFLPFYHGYAFGMLIMLAVGSATGVIAQSFDRLQFLETIQRYRISHLALVPPIFIFLAKEPIVKKYDLSSVRIAVCGAAPIPSELTADVKRHMKNTRFLNAYGMTELTIVSTATIKPIQSLESVGVPLAGYQVKVVNPSTGELLPEKEIGELCFKGERLMLGYYNNKTATDDTIDKDGWLHTGDLGYYDKEGKFYITGRLKELIKYKGYQVTPVELEQLILAHPGVKDVAVVGKPDEKAGELPFAFVVKQPNSNVSADEIIKLVNNQLSSPKWLRGGVKFIDVIPKSASGKILRKELSQMLPKL